MTSPSQPQNMQQQRMYPADTEIQNMLHDHMCPVELIPVLVSSTKANLTPYTQP